MFPLFESIRIIEGELQNLGWHQKRFEQSYEKLFGIKTNSKLYSKIRIPAEYKRGNVKLRFLYNKDSYAYNFSKYTPVKIYTLKMVIKNNIDYSLKYTDRSDLNYLFELRGDCEDILIIKNGLITDSSISNIVFYDGKSWVTPLKPLLKGACRERLIPEGKISPIDITVDDLKNFSKFKLINAMRDFEEQEGSDISGIK